MRRFVVILIALVLSGCHKPTVEEHIARAEALLTEQKPRDAIVAYRAALLLDPRRGDVRVRLSDIHMLVGDVRSALGEAVRAADLLPNDPAAQVRAGSLLLLSHSYVDASARARNALALKPSDPEALILLGNAMAGLQDFDGALSQFEQASVFNSTGETAYQSIAALRASRGERAEAAEAFRRAIDLAPKSPMSRLAYASFLWSSGRATEAEATLKEALAIAPSSLPVNRALATFYLASRRGKEAGPYVEAVARLADTPTAILTLADYYVLLGRPDDARNTLVGLSKRPSLSLKSDNYAATMTRLAAMDARAGQQTAAISSLDQIIKDRPAYMPARLAKAKALLLAARPDDALIEASVIVKDEPMSPIGSSAYLIIGGIHADADRREEAIDAYREALKGQPDPAAHLALVALYLAGQNIEAASMHAEAALAASPTRPLTRALMVKVMLAKGETSRAKAMLASLQKELPKSPTVLNLLGFVALAEGRVDAARTAYAESLKTAPDNIEATSALVRLDLNAGRTKDALDRVEASLRTVDRRADFYSLAARAYLAAKQPQRAEVLLKQAIDTAPMRLEVYESLGRLYVSQGRAADAERQFREMVKVNSRSTSAGTMLGMILETQGRTADAEAEYRRVLSLDPRAAIAANNLAWIYVSNGRELDEANRLAAAACQASPSEPNFNDTLGWILVQKGQPRSAIPYLLTSVKNDPRNPIGHFHLGMAYSLVEEVEKARQSLTQALALNQTFPGAEEARRALVSISGAKGPFDRVHGP